jgi:alcohol dehydrogenase (cytochrome c)
MDFMPTGDGLGSGALSAGYNWMIRPREGSDGLFGHIQAINVGENMSEAWVERQRAPQSTGVLATAGGLVFAGALDRNLTAYDDMTGEALWQVKLNDVPNTNPVTFAVDGKQYVAIVVGYGGAQTATWPRLVPEISLPAAPSSSVWVFELP